MSEEITLEQKFEKISKYHNDVGFLNFLMDESKKGESNVDYDIELAIQLLFVINGHVEDKIEGDNRNIAVEALYHAMELYEADKQAKKDAVQKMMAEEEAGTIQGRLNAMKEKMPSLNQLTDTAKAEVEKMKGKLDESKAAAAAKVAEAAEKMKSFNPFSGGKRRSKKNKSKKNKSKKSKKSRK